MKVSHNWLQRYFKEPIPSSEKLSELFTFHSFEVEGLESAGKDSVLDVKILPDRAHYCLSHKGIAGEISVLTNVPVQKKEIQKLNITLDSQPKIVNEAPDFCRRYMGRFVELGEASSPEWVRDLLSSIGQRSISPIVDATNFVMFDVGQPLHAFDADKVKGSIIVRAAKPGEKIALLDSSEGVGREVELTTDDHVIADDEGPLAIAGVKGGKRAAITSETKRLILESANFHPTAVRRTSTKFDLRSDSSKRYENEITPELTALGMQELSALIMEMSPKSKFGPVVDVYPVKAKKNEINFNPQYLEERLGIKVPEDKSKSILQMMGVELAHDGECWKLTIPFDRMDMVIPEDVVEEIGRVYGYEHIEGILPEKTGKPVPVSPMFYFAEKIKNVLVEHGFSEVILYSLVDSGDIETAYPLAKDKAFARKNLSDGMVICVEKNVLNADLLGLEAIKIFEIGHVFSKETEEIHLSIGAAQVKKQKGVRGETIINDVVEILKKELSVEFKPTAKMVTKGNASVAEFSLDISLGSYKAGNSYEDLGFKPASTNRYQKFSQYPFIVRDIAVFVPESVQSEEVWSFIQKGIGEAESANLLARHSLFDVFQKDGKTSYAFRMVFQSKEETLTDEDANYIMEKIYFEMKQKGWEVR